MDPAIATILGAIIGAVIAGPVSYFVAKRITDVQREASTSLAKAADFNCAAAIFFSAFTETIRKLEETDSQNPHEIVGAGYVNHWNAVIQFRPYLDQSERIRITKAWETYKSEYHDHAFNSLSGGKEKVRNCANSALAHIQKMLDTAKFK
jgi:hypothetical protein